MDSESSRAEMREANSAMHADEAEPRSPPAECGSHESTLSVSIEPAAVEQSRVFDLLGQINYKILRGHTVYLRACGTTYKVLHGIYWQSVFSGIQHWGLRCAAIESGMWAEEYLSSINVELPLRFTKDGWIVEAATFQFLLAGDFPAFLDCPLAHNSKAEIV
ncbi:MAG: hypothetical protein WCD76_06915 [Pyrinomonadaceae bacterium]